MNELSPSANPEATDAVRSLPADWYFDPAIHEAERRRIFAKTWQFIGPESEFRRPGDYRAVQVAGYRLFVIRERSGGLKAFHNICPHRAAPLLTEGDGHCDVLRCRYHGWTFATDGRLMATPNFGEAQWFDKKSHGLTPVRVEAWRGLVFAAIDDQAPALVDFLGDIPALLEPYSIESFGKLDQAEFMINCNWKTYTDNFVEGYHIPGIHAGLNAAIDMTRFKTTHRRGVVIMKAPQKGGSIYGGLWLWIWPNMTLSVYPDGMNTSRIVPIDEVRTELRYEFYFADPGAGLTEKRRATIETNCQIVREDFGICEDVQQNLRSGIYRDGPLSPRHEDGVKYFQDMVRASLGAMKTRRIVLAARPQGLPKPSDFRSEEAEVPAPKGGDVLLAIQYLSLDPYMRGRMDDRKSYAKPTAIGQEMEGGTVASVLESRAADFKPGDTVLSYSGWQSHAVAKAAELRKLDPKEAPVTTALGILGMPGFTAYAGLLTIGKPKPGETVVVAAATGPVGATVGQIAKIKGARAVGIAGSTDKCAYLRDALGFDAAIDHRAKDLAEQLAKACPKGIDVYFENVGGAVWDAVFPLLNDFARIPLCGLVAQYNETGPFAGPDRFPLVMREALSRRFHIQGFIQRDFPEQRPAFYREMGQWIREGKVKYREDIVDGLERAPEAFIGMLQGKNFGKLVVRVA